MNGSSRVAARVRSPWIGGLWLFALCALLVARPQRAAAQLPIPHFGIVGGVSRYTLSHAGTTPFGALRVEIPLLMFVGEGSLGVFRPHETDGTPTYVIPEVQLQYQFLPFIVRPYVGVGGGWFRAVSGTDPRGNELTGSASAGVRITPPILGFGLRGEVRVRGVGSSWGSRNATEYLLGISF